MKNKEKEPLLLRIGYAIINAGAFIYILASMCVDEIKRIPKKINVCKEKGIDFWYKHVIKKERPSKYLESKEYVDMIKDEVYKVWPKNEMNDLLEKYGTSFGNVKLSNDTSKEDICTLYAMSLEMSHRYTKASSMLMEKIRNLELDCEVVYHRKYINKKGTRRQALMIDELLELLEKLKSEPYECEMTEEQKNEITVEFVENMLNNRYLIMELSAIYLPSVVSQADLKKAINKMEELLANPPSRKTA